MNIAIFGGSFDPVHLAHVAIVNNALESLKIEKFFVVPTYLNPFKNSFKIEPITRYELLKKVFSKFENVEICDYEISQNKPTYSIDTVKYLKNKYNASKIYFIIGADNLKNLDKWHKIDEMNSLVEFVVATRNGFEIKEANKFKTLDININISSTQLREKLNLDYIPSVIENEILDLENKN